MANNNCPNNSATIHPSEHILRVTEDAMLRLMPGWFEMLDEMMDPHGPDLEIYNVACKVQKNPGIPIDDIIHEHFKDDWFSYHSDGEHY